MYKLQTLKNGLRLLTVPVSGTKTATILVMVGTGSKYETRENNGISHFLEHMFFKGTEKRPNAMALSSELDSVGAEFNAFTGKEYTGFYVKTDAKQIELGMDIVSDMLLYSLFDEKEIEKEKGVIIEEINMYEDNPIYHIEDIFEQCLYGDQPAGWETIGTKENIKKFKREDFLNYLTSQYGAGNSVVCLAGDIKNETVEKIEKYFSNLKRSEFKNKLATEEKQTEPNALVNFKKTDQANLSLGARAFPVGHPDEDILRVIAILLGGSMSSRLFHSLREERGLAYYVRTGTEFYTDSGYITTQAGVPVDKIEDAIKVILEEYNRLKNEPVSKEELQKVKDLIRGRLTIQLESSDANASWYARQMVLRNEAITPLEYLKKVNHVTAKDIKRVAESIFKNESLNLAVIGPYGEEKNFKNLLKL